METKERRVVPVDEKVIRAMMEGDVPGVRLDGGMPPVEEQPADEPSVDAERQEESAPGPRPRKRREQKGYADIFLEKLPAIPRKHTYISIAMYNDLSELLPVVARGVSIPNFLENLLKHHFDTYRDEINELYENKTKKRY
jgi:hypothetical protein